jgi:hypothetical protein
MLGIMHFVLYGLTWSMSSLCQPNLIPANVDNPAFYPEGVLASPWCLHLGAQNCDWPHPLNQNDMDGPQRT